MLAFFLCDNKAIGHFHIIHYLWLLLDNDIIPYSNTFNYSYYVQQLCVKPIFTPLVNVINCCIKAIIVFIWNVNSYCSVNFIWSTLFIHGLGIEWPYAHNPNSTLNNFLLKDVFKAFSTQLANAILFSSQWFFLTIALSLSFLKAIWKA